MSTPTSTAEPTEHGVSIVIPAYQEEHGIGAVLEQIQEVMSGASWPYEVIVVDDGSEDATASIAAQNPHTQVLRHRLNQGYGAALKTGIRQAHYPLVCITDADGTYPNERIPDLVQHQREHECDMVVGARTGPNVAIPRVRRPAKWVLNQFANFVASDMIPDLNSGLRVFRRETVLQMSGILPSGFSFTSTITLAMLMNHYIVQYVSIDYHPRVGTSKIRPIKDTINFVQLLLRIGLYFAPLKVFLPISGVLLLMAFGWALITKILWGQLADVSTLIIAMTGLQIAIIGLLAELINGRLSNEYRKVE